MLKYFRNKKTMGYLVGSGLLVLVIFAFIVLYIPDFLAPGSATNSGNEVANVAGVPITAQQFVQRYRMQERVYRAQFGEQFNPAMMKQLGMDEMVLQGLIQEVLLAVEADSQGLIVTDEELSEQILKDPSFQSNGQFIGREAYLALLRQSGLTPQDYETQIRQALLRQKLQNMLMDGVTVSPQEVQTEYRRRNEKASLEYFFIPRSDYEDQVTVTDDDVAAYYEAQQEDYRLPVQRKARTMTITPQSFQDSVKVTDREIERYYNRNIYLYETPEQVGASHILFKTAEKDEDEVRRQAEKVLSQIQSGADFAEMAKEYSEDTSADNGGSLGLFGRGEMVPEFEQAAFSLDPGQVSDLVRTTYGFHIIKVTEKQDPMTRPLESVRAEILNTLKMEKSQDKMEEAVSSAATFLQSAQSLETLAQQYPGIELQETAFFGPQDSVPQLGNSREARELAFELAMGKPSSPVRVGTGYAFFEVLEEREPRVPPLDEIKEKVRADLVKARAMESALTQAEDIAQKLQSGQKVERVASAFGLELKTSDSFTRTSNLPESGRSPAAKDVAFTGELDSFSKPLQGENGYVVLRVLERTGFSSEEFDSDKGTFSEQVLSEKRQRAWSSYLQELQRRYAVSIDREALRRLTS
jgi:peptidyl-prolyl cis-trans isomerase D